MTDDTRQLYDIHPDAAYFDEQKTTIYSQHTSREQLAQLIAQIYAEDRSVSANEMDYYLADEFLGIIRIDRNEKENN